MKNKLTHLTTLLATGLAVLAFTACNKAERNTVADTTKEAYNDSKAALSRGWDNVKSYTYEKRSDFTQAVQAQEASFEAGMSKLRAEYSEEKASASRKAAMNELKADEANYKEKLAALGSATADTWDAARDNVVAAWDRLQASYAKAKAN